MKNYCKVCDSAYAETIQENAYYVCTMCRDHIEKNEPDRRLKEDNLIEKLVTDFGND